MMNTLEDIKLINKNRKIHTTSVHGPLKLYYCLWFKIFITGFAQRGLIAIPNSQLS